MPETNPNNVFCVVPVMDAVQNFPMQPPSGVIVARRGRHNRAHVVYSVEQCQHILGGLRWLPAERREAMLEAIEDVSLFDNESPPSAITIAGVEASLLVDAMGYYRSAVEGSEEKIPYPFERPKIISLRLPATGVRGGAVLGIHDRGPSVHIAYSRADVRRFVELYPHSNGNDETTRIHRLHLCGLPETSARQPLHITGYAARTLLLGLVIMSLSLHPPVFVITLANANGAPEDDLPS